MANLKEKDFILDVVAQMQQNPRKALAGYGIPPVIIKEIKTREDVLSKFANFLLSTKLATRGANGLKKSKNLQITGYINIKAMQKSIEQDLAAFFGEDNLAESLESNCFVIAYSPQREVENETEMQVNGVKGKFVTTKIINGRSVILPYSKAISAGSSVPGTKYLVVAFNDAIIRPKDASVAFSKAKRNERIVARELKPAKIKAQLKKALERVKSREKMLLGKRAQYQAAIAERNSATEMNDYIESLSGVDKTLFDKALQRYIAGDKRSARIMVNGAEDPAALYAAVEFTAQNSENTNLHASMKRDVKAYNKELAELLDIVNQLNQSGREIPDSIQRKVNVLVNKIEKLQARLKAEDKRLKRNRKASATVDYQQLLAKTNRLIERNTQRGMKLSKSLDAVVKSLGVDETTAQQLKASVLEEIAAGAEQQEAVQQAFEQQQEAVQQAYYEQQQQQQEFVDEDEEDIEESGDYSIADLFAKFK